MCGISGASIRLIEKAPQAVLNSMNNVLKHRGPDDEGIYCDDLMGLAHTRLSIIDLSVNGRQPMVSHDKKYVITFNGEIYNFLQLRKELLEAGCQFETRTDTEVLLNSYKEFGTECLRKIRGMYAFAIWDKEKKELFLCRDRIGKKPLYYYYDGKDIAFPLQKFYGGLPDGIGTVGRTAGEDADRGIEAVVPRDDFQGRGPA